MRDLNNHHPQLHAHLIKALQMRDFDSVEELAKKDLERRPASVETKLALGIAYIRSGKYAAARSLMSETISAYPYNIDALHVGSTAYCHLGEPETAEKLLRHALHLDNRNPETLFLLGNVYKKIGHLKEAESSYQHALELDPSHVLALNNLGIVYQESGKNEIAIKTYQQGLRVDPNYPSFHYNLGCIYVTQGNHASALTEFSQAAKSRPGWIDAMLQYAKMLEKTSADDKASDVYWRILAIDAKNLEAHLSLGRILADAGKTEAAIELLQRATVEYPTDLRAFLGLIDLYEKTGRFHLALKMITDFSEGLPLHPAIGIRYARIARRIGKKSEALTMLESVLAENPHNGELLEEYIALTGETREGRAHILPYLGRLLELEPENSTIHKKLAALATQEGDHEYAKKILTSFLEVHPRDKSGWLALAKVYAALNNWEATLPILQKLEMDAPDDAHIQLELVSAYRALGLKVDAVRAAERLVTLCGLSVTTTATDMLNSLETLESTIEDYSRSLETKWTYNLDILKKALVALDKRSIHAWDHIDEEETNIGRLRSGLQLDSDDTEPNSTLVFLDDSEELSNSPSYQGGILQQGSGQGAFGMGGKPDSGSAQPGSPGHMSSPSVDNNATEQPWDEDTASPGAVRSPKNAFADEKKAPAEAQGLSNKEWADIFGTSGKDRAEKFADRDNSLSNDSESLSKELSDIFGASGKNDHRDASRESPPPGQPGHNNQYPLPSPENKEQPARPLSPQSMAAAHDGFAPLSEDSLIGQNLPAFAPFDHQDPRSATRLRQQFQPATMPWDNEAARAPHSNPAIPGSKFPGADIASNKSQIPGKAPPPYYQEEARQRPLAAHGEHEHNDPRNNAIEGWQPPWQKPAAASNTPFAKLKPEAQSLAAEDKPGAKPAAKTAQAHQDQNLSAAEMDDVGSLSDEADFALPRWESSDDSFLSTNGTGLPHAQSSAGNSKDELNLPAQEASRSKFDASNAEFPDSMNNQQSQDIDQGSDIAHEQNLPRHKDTRLGAESRAPFAEDDAFPELSREHGDEFGQDYPAPELAESMDEGESDIAVHDMALSEEAFPESENFADLFDSFDALQGEQDNPDQPGVSNSALDGEGFASGLPEPDFAYAGEDEECALPIDGTDNFGEPFTEEALDSDGFEDPEPLNLASQDDSAVWEEGNSTSAASSAAAEDAAADTGASIEQNASGGLGPLEIAELFDYLRSISTFLPEEQRQYMHAIKLDERIDSLVHKLSPAFVPHSSMQPETRPVEAPHTPYGVSAENRNPGMYNPSMDSPPAKSAKTSHNSKAGTENIKSSENFGLRSQGNSMITFNQVGDPISIAGIPISAGLSKLLKILKQEKVDA